MIPSAILTLIRPDATWAPGAWTPARCALWREMGEGEMRQRLEQWVFAERQRKRCHRGQLPEVEGRVAA